MSRPVRPQGIVKTEPPRLQIVSYQEKELIDKLVRQFKLTYPEAKGLVDDESKWKRFVNVIKKTDHLKKLEVMTRLWTSINESIDTKKVGDAQKGITGIAILQDKVFHEPVGGAMSIQGKNVQVNLGWKFRPRLQK